MNISVGIQEKLALSAVALVFLWNLVKAWRKYAAQPLADVLLRQGRVKSAMWMRQWALHDSSCDRCQSKNSL